MTFQRLPQIPPLELPENLKEMFALMEPQGLNPQFCDTPVPYFDAGIPCGTPREVYEATPDGYILVPRSLRSIWMTPTRMHFVLFIPLYRTHVKIRVMG